MAIRWQHVQRRLCARACQAHAIHQVYRVRTRSYHFHTSRRGCLRCQDISQRGLSISLSEPSGSLRGLSRTPCCLSFEQLQAQRLGSFDLLIGFDGACGGCKLRFDSAELHIR